MVAARALNGKRRDDSLAAIHAADVAITMAEKVNEDDITAQASLWAGIAYFYHGDSKRSQFYLDRAHHLKEILELNADKKILHLWTHYGVVNKSAETRREGYDRNYRFAPIIVGNRRRSSWSTNSSAGTPIQTRQWRFIPWRSSNLSAISLPESDEGMQFRKSHGIEIEADSK